MKYKAPKIVVEPPGPNAREIIKRDEILLSPSLTRTSKLVGYKAEGVYVEDVDGNVSHVWIIFQHPPFQTGCFDTLACNLEGQERSLAFPFYGK